MSNISLCPHCKTYVDTEITPSICPTCNESLSTPTPIASNKSETRATFDKKSSESPSQNDIEPGYIRCPSCGDLVSTNYRPVTCYKCGPVPIDPKSLPPLTSNFNESVYVPNYLIPNIILCFIGCLLPAFIGVVYSLLAMRAKGRGDFILANSHASNAKTSMTVTIVLSALGWLAWCGNHIH